MSKLLVVVGATGQQGSSVITHVLNDAALSQQYRIRAITRNTDSEKAQALKESVEVVQGDISDRASLETALKGVHTIFIMTPPGVAPDVEYTMITTAASIAVSKGASYIIFSTLPSVSELSGGKYTKVFGFDIKAQAEQYIRQLPVHSAFVSLASFYENFEAQSFLAPRKSEDDGRWVVKLHAAPTARMPFVSVVKDTGTFVAAILAAPEKFAGKTVCAAARFYTMEEAVRIMSQATGKSIAFEKIEPEEFKKSLGWPEPVADMFTEMIAFVDEFGYFGKDGEKEVVWAVENARGGRLTSLEEYLAAHPLRLE